MFLSKSYSWFTVSRTGPGRTDWISQSRHTFMALKMYFTGTSPESFLGLGNLGLIQEENII